MSSPASSIIQAVLVARLDNLGRVRPVQQFRTQRG